MNRLKTVTDKNSAKDYEATFFMLRVPARGVDNLLGISSQLLAPVALQVGDTQALEEALTQDRAAITQRVRTQAADQKVKAAIYVAAPEFYKEFDKWLTAPGSVANSTKVERTVYSYLARMAARPQPFGLFAGYMLGEVGANSRFTIPDDAEACPHSRLSYECVAQLAAELSKIPDFRSELRYFTNTSVYRVADGYRYFERPPGTDDAVLTFLEATPYLDYVCDRARTGATLDELAIGVLRATGTEQAPTAGELSDARQYVAELVDRNLLESELTPELGGPDALDVLIDKLSRLPCSENALQTLREVSQLLVTVDRERDIVAAYEKITKHLSTLAVPLKDNGRMLQVDLTWHGSVPQLGEDIAHELFRAASVLQRVTPQSKTALRTFAEDLEERYGNEPVRLVDALDEDGGITFGDTPEALPSLAQGLPFPGATDGGSAKIGVRERLLVSLVREAERAGRREVVLSDSDIEALSTSQGPLPDAFAVVASINAPSAEALSEGKFRIVFKHGHGPSGAQLFGRFSQNDARVRTALEQFFKKEQELEPDAVFAEIAHLPVVRAGNIMRRSKLRQYEIPFMARLDFDATQQVRVDDLWVSSSHGRVTLISGTLGRIVKPRLTSAHNHYPTLNYSIYRFLAALQEQDSVAALRWRWNALELFDYLPAVVHGRSILCRQRWRITPREFESCSSRCGTAEYKFIREWRRERNVPVWIVIVETDLELPINLDNIANIEAFVRVVKSQNETMISDCELSDSSWAATGVGGRRPCDVVVPFVRRVVAEVPANHGGDSAPQHEMAVSVSSRGIRERRQKEFLSVPGGQWVYVKLYCGARASDTILTRHVGRLIEFVRRECGVESWFFIRYADPRSHLRIRIKVDASMHASIVREIYLESEALIDTNLAWRIQWDGYQREISRYGGLKGIELAEHLFSADSDAVLNLFRNQPGIVGADLRWQSALYGIDVLLSDFGLDVDGKLAVVAGLRRVFDSQFRTTRELKSQLGKKHSALRDQLTAILRPDSVLPSQVVEVFSSRSIAHLHTIKCLRSAESSRLLERPLSEILPSFVHMHLNRILRPPANHQEFVLYDLLCRYYTAQIKRPASRIDGDTAANAESGTTRGTH